LEDQVVEHILANANVSEIDSSYEDVIAGRAVPQGSETQAAEESASA
jgi:hypothetical protein